MKQRAFAVSGILAPIVYVIAVVPGGALWPGCNQVSRYIGDLPASGVPNAWVLNPLFGLFNLLVLVYGIGFLRSARSSVDNPRARTGKAGAIVPLLQGFFGVATLFFPEDPAGSRITMVGRTSSMCLGVYSLISVGFVFVTGGITTAMGSRGLTSPRRSG